MLALPRRAVAVLACAPFLLAGCGSDGSIGDFCVVYQQLDDADDEDDYLPLIEDLVEVAPTDRVEAAAEVLRHTWYLYEANGRRDVDELPALYQDNVEGAGDYLMTYAEQTCRIS